MRTRLAVAILIAQSEGLRGRFQKLVARGGSAELTSRLRANAKRVQLLAARIRATEIKDAGPIICPERLLVFGEWSSARWKPWPWALAQATIVRLLLVGAIEGPEARAVWEAYRAHSLGRTSSQTKR